MTRFMSDLSSITTSIIFQMNRSTRWNQDLQTMKTSKLKIVIEECLVTLHHVDQIVRESSASEPNFGCQNNKLTFAAIWTADNFLLFCWSRSKFRLLNSEEGFQVDNDKLIFKPIKNKRFNLITQLNISKGSNLVVGTLLKRTSNWNWIYLHL